MQCIFAIAVPNPGERLKKFEHDAEKVAEAAGPVVLGALVKKG